MQSRGAAGSHRARAWSREEPRRAPDDGACGTRGGRAARARRHGTLDGWPWAYFFKDCGKQEGGWAVPRTPPRPLDHLVRRRTARHAAARAGGEPPARVSRGRHERTVHAQSAGAGQCAREDRGRNGAHDVDQARGGASLHRRSIGTALHQSRRLAGRCLRHPSPDGYAHRQAQRNGLRATQEGGRLIHEFRARLSRYKKQEPRLARRALADDPAITAAVHAHMVTHGMSEQAVRRQVRTYLNEIIPHFNVLSYYKIGYNVAKIVVNLLYKTSVDHQDERALERIPRHDVVVYLMNHRSNADYVGVAYGRARGAHGSY